jgi:nicotinamidase/pyrazinamidase
MLHIDYAHTASLDIDPQRGFTPLCPDELPVTGGDEIAGELNTQGALARYRLVSKDCHPVDAPWRAETPEEVMTPVTGDHPGLDIKWPAHCVIGTEGNRLLPGLPAEDDYDLVIEKGMDPEQHPYGACYHDLAETESTGTIEWLQAHGIETILCGGLATDFCVKTTALQLRRAGFRVIINLAGCRGVAPDLTEQAVAEMQAAGIEMVASANDLQTDC